VPQWPCWRLHGAAELRIPILPHIDLVYPVKIRAAHANLCALAAQGQDCFGAFMAWGLPKEVLREVWALVAGSQGQLDKHQFVSALYLMDSVKKVLQPSGTLSSITRATEFPCLHAKAAEGEHAAACGMRPCCRA
jgi:hypothetical protein